MMSNSAGIKQPDDSLRGRIAGGASTLVGIYQALMQSRVDYNLSKWNTVRASVTLATGFLIAIGGAASVLGQVLSDSQTVCGCIVAGLSLPMVIAALYLRWWGAKNLRRETHLQYHDEFPMYQIERLLGLHQPIPAEDWWLRAWPAKKPPDRAMFGHKHLTSDYGTDSYEKPVPPLAADGKGDDSGAPTLEPPKEPSIGTRDGDPVHDWVLRRTGEHKFLQMWTGIFSPVLVILVLGAVAFLLMGLLLIIF